MTSKALSDDYTCRKSWEGHILRRKLKVLTVSCGEKKDLDALCQSQLGQGGNSWNDKEVEIYPDSIEHRSEAPMYMAPGRVAPGLGQLCSNKQEGQVLSGVSMGNNFPEH